MKITFVSNYINHHQIPFSKECYDRLEGAYYFIQTKPMDAERIAMGWEVDTLAIPYVHQIYKEPVFCEQLIMESDIVIFGWAEREDLVDKRLASGKITLRMSERIYREGQWKAISPRGLIEKYKAHIRYRKSPVYLLCAGAYVASDFDLIKAYPGKMLRFGYFPETKYHNEEQLFMEKEKDGKVHLVWAGRFLPLKHPEYALRLARELKKEGVLFHLHMAGGGELENLLRQEVIQEDMEKEVTFYGFQKPNQVREIMEKCHISLFTSNHLEGWGAVVNEAMNSGCAVVGSVEAGAIPFLIAHETNGLVYKDSIYAEFAMQAKRLVYDATMREKIGRAAFQTIMKGWNATHAAEELIRFSSELLQGSYVPAKEGPLSLAPVIKPKKMYEKMMEHHMP